MASITKKKIGNNFYYYLVESKRVDKKPRIVYQKYLGPAKTIKEKLEQSDLFVPEELDYLYFGDVAALTSIAKEIGLVETVNRHTSKRIQGMSVGEYFMALVINRALNPTSKSRINDWVKRTPLYRWINLPQGAISSQNFWDHMHYLNQEEITRIENDLCQSILEKFEVNLDRLIYDATNFFTYFEADNQSSLAKHGKNKAKRYDLRQINLALLVTKEFGIPLLHKTYPGNENDVSFFPSITEELKKHHDMLAKYCSDITVVFDKGNNSEDNIQKFDQTDYSFVGSLHPSRFQEWLDIPLDDFNEPGNTPFHRFKTELFGKERTVVITYNERLRRKKEHKLSLQLAKKEIELAELQGKLNTHKWKRKATITKKIKEILSDKQTKDLIEFSVRKREGKIIMSTCRNQENIDAVINRFGKTLVFTNRHDWATNYIAEVYRGKDEVEDDFKEMKDPYHVSTTPLYHWTDQKIRVHIFSCVVALTLLRLLQKKLSDQGITASLKSTISQLKSIQEILLYFQNGIHRRISKLDEEQKVLFDTLNLSCFTAKETS